MRVALVHSPGCESGVRLGSVEGRGLFQAKGGGWPLATCSHPETSPSSLPWTLSSLHPSCSHSTCLLGSTSGSISCMKHSLLQLSAASPPLNVYSCELPVTLN